MKKVVFKGKNVDEAVDGAVKVLGVHKEDVAVKVLSEGKPGMLGVIGGEEAEVEVSVKGSLAEEARDCLQEILDRMRLMALAKIASDDENGVVVDVQGEDLGMIIGKEGATLKALQTLVSSIIGRARGERARITVDAGGYKNKHEQAIERLAKEAAKDVEESGEDKILPYLSAADRRLMHMALKDNPKIKTFSEGDGAARRLIISRNK